MLNKLVTIFSFLFTFQGYAEGIDLKYGLGVALPDENSAAVKYFGFSYNWEFAYPTLQQKVELGIWADSNTSRASSVFGAYSVGLRVQPSIFYLESYWGVAFITGLDRRLSSPVQFTQDLGVGVQDKSGRYLGVTWKHISNAGLTQPNRGRDFILIQVGREF